MISWSARRSSVRCAALAGGCACVFWNGSAGAQSAAFEPDLWPIAPVPAPTSGLARDRPSSEAREATAASREHLRVGAFVGVGFPRPLAVEGIVKVERAVAVGLEYSTLPRITVADVQMGAWAIAGSARVFPFRGPFFVGLRAGRQHLNAQAAVSGYGYSVPVSLAVDTTFINPQVGFMWTWAPGFSVGLDAGLQIPLSSSTSSAIQTGMPAVVQTYVTPLQNTLESVAGAVGQTVLPTIDLLRVGMLF